MCGDRAFFLGFVEQGKGGEVLEELLNAQWGKASAALSPQIVLDKLQVGLPAVEPAAYSFKAVPGPHADRALRFGD